MTVAALAAIIGLASCATEEFVSGDANGSLNGGNAGKSDLKSVNLKIGSSSPSTRAEGNSMSNGAVTFNGGFLLFVSDENNITKVMEITTGLGVQNDTQVDISLLTQPDGADITDVPGHSKSAWVIGNLPGNISAPVTGESLTTLKGKLVGYASQHDITNVTLFGGSTIVPENQKLVARFELAPVVARIEIKKIESAIGSDITSFRVDGIFINNYYDEIQLDGYAPNVAVNHEQEGDFALNSLAYPTAENGYLFDYETGLGVGLGTTSDAGRSYKPSAGDAWAYNLLAPKTFATAASAPHIVIRLSGITTTSGVNYNDVWYLTISGLKVGLNKVDYLEPGKVYLIDNILFAQSNIQPDPEMKPIEVAVEVSLVDWQVKDTEVIFGQE
ncbi:MAG: hypothetical protein LBR86_06395 [Tannerella sp.]|nr:hypothetical protein [Tannerella sp.]